MKADAIGVHRIATRPVGQSAVDPIERFEAMLPRCLADDGAEVARVQPPFTGDPALFVGRQPFDLPRRKEQVRKGVRRPAEDAARDARPAFRSIEVHDVRELVREYQAEPVVELGAGSGRRHRIEDHGVVRHRSGISIEQFGLVGEHDVCEARRGEAERLLERVPGLLGDSRQALRERVFTLMELDDEVLGRERAETQRRIEDLRRRPGAGADDDGGREKRADPSRRARHADWVLTTRCASVWIHAWHARG